VLQGFEYCEANSTQVREVSKGNPKNNKKIKKIKPQGKTTSKSLVYQMAQTQGGI